MYTQLYHFTEKPFNLTPDPKFLYLTSQHREALASMIYGIRERRGFISITGEVGTGKTTLIYTLLNNLSEKEKTVFLYHTNTTFEQILENILLELDIKVTNQDKISLLRKLNEYLIHKLNRDETLAVIIDEAQNLSKEVMEELRMLSNLETCKSKLLQMVLVGQPELEIKLNSPDLRQLKQRIGIRRQIKPLTFEESRAYIEHRLQHVGSTISKVFTPQAISMICRYSKGIPRNINVISENAFLIGYSLSKKKITAQIIKEVISDMSGSLSLQEPSEANTYFVPNFRMIAAGAVLLLLFGAVAFMGTEYLKSRNPEVPASNGSAIQHIPASPLQGKAPVTGNTVRPVNSPPAPPVEKQGQGYLILRTVTVKDDDNLSSLAQHYYGMSNETLLDIILMANPQITDVNRISRNQQIDLPEINHDSLIIKSPDNTYKIHVGTYNSLLHARDFYYEYSLIGKEVDIIPRKVSDKESWYRVVVSTFETRDECLKTLATLRQKGLLPVY